MISSDVMVEGHAHPGEHGTQSAIPMELYEPRVQSSVGGVDVSTQEYPAGQGVQLYNKQYVCSLEKYGE